MDRRGITRRRRADTPAARLAEAERLFLDYLALTPFKPRVFSRTFESFGEYERWKRAQTDPRDR